MSVAVDFETTNYPSELRALVQADVGEPPPEFPNLRLRPATFLSFFLACGFALYLCQERYRSLANALSEKNSTLEQIRILHAEWTLLNQPDRLQKLADEFLHLKPSAPNQFVSADDLDKRLPPIAKPPEAPQENRLRSRSGTGSRR